MMTVEMPETRASATPSRAILTGSPVTLFEDREIDLLAERLQLLDRGRTVDVGGDQQRLRALLFQTQRELAGLRRLTRALQTDQHDDRRRRVGELQARLRAAEQLDQLVVDDLDDRLRRRQRFEDVCADRLLFDASDERLGARKRDVGLEQRDANFAQRLVDVAFAETARGRSAARKSRLSAR